MTSRRQMLTGVAGLAAASALGLPAAFAQGSNYGIQGRQAPELEVDWWIDRNGRPTSFTLAGARGKWIYLKCFQNWCPGCHKYGFPALKKVADAFENNDRVVAVGVQTVFEGFSTNTRYSVRELQLRYALPITMGHDPGDHDRRPSTMRLYRTGGTPWVIIISPEGQVVFNHFHVAPEKSIPFLKKQIA